MRGIQFEIPNEYGKYLDEILRPIDVQQYYWKTGGEEAYYIENNELGTPLFQTACVMKGAEFQLKITNLDYYLIFADLKAFSNEDDLCEVRTYEQFVKSRCELALLVVDCTMVIIYMKNKQQIHLMKQHAQKMNYKNIEIITDDNDLNTTLIAF